MNVDVHLWMTPVREGTVVHHPVGKSSVWSAIGSGDLSVMGTPIDRRVNIEWMEKLEQYWKS